MITRVSQDDGSDIAFNAWMQCIVILLVLIVATAVTCLPLRLLKWILVVLTALYLGVYLWIGMAGGVWLSRGHTTAINLGDMAQWLPSGTNFAVFGLVILALLGVDIPLFMGGEIHGGVAGTRKRSRYVWWGAALAALAYVVGTFGVMAVVSPALSGGMPANVLAVAQVFGPLAGAIVAATLILSQVAIAIAYLLLFSRLIVIVAQDRWLPQKLTHVNRHGVPVLSIVVQSVIVALVALLTFVVVPLLFTRLVPPDRLAFDIYNVLMAGASALWSFSTALLFFFVTSLCYRAYRAKQHAVFTTWEQIRLVGMSIAGIVASIVGIWATISSSWLPNTISNQNWTIIVLAVVGLSIAIGYVGSELPRMHALLGEQKRVNDRELALRGQLQEAYDQQKVLLDEVDRLYREQAEAAVTDAVTSLPNHRAIMARLDEEIERCRRSGARCAIAFIDLDHFKRVNDTWGHRAGDAILREMGRRLRAAIRMQDFVGRYGGEEFAVLLTDIQVDGALQAAERLRSAIGGDPFIWHIEGTENVQPIQISGSIGVSLFGLHGVTRESLIESADQAMYQAKQSGRDCVCMADVELDSVEQPSGEWQPRQSTAKTMPLQAVQALIAAASAHARGTDEHAHRLMLYAQETALALGCSDDDLSMLKLAAPLHDIGKIGVPDTILHKPGPLNDEEWEVMRRHPQIGRQILDQIGGIFRYLAPIVVAHHERWDGKGYPNNLSGEDIPLASRILSVVDSYDAMTSLRPYRAPMSREQAEQELLHCSGSQFDPRIVAAFLRVLRQQKEERPQADDAQPALAER